MNYYVDFSEQALLDVAYHKKSGNQIILKRISLILNDLFIKPYEGIGKPEKLKHELSGYWSRRISKEHRIIYQVIDNRILIHSLKGHYK